MYNWLKDNDLFWKGFIAFYFGKQTFELLKESNKKKKMTWKERTKLRFKAMKEDNFIEVGRGRYVPFKAVRVKQSESFDLVKDLGITHFQKGEDVFKILSNCTIGYWLNFQTENVDTKEQRKESLLCHFGTDCEGKKVMGNHFYFPTNQFFEPKISYVHSVKEIEDLEVIEICTNDVYKFRMSYSRKAFDLVKFFRSRKGKRVMLSYILTKRIRVLGWEYQND